MNFRSLLFLALVLFFPGFLTVYPVKASSEGAQPVQLVGQVYSLSVFVSTPGHEWKFSDKVNILRKQAEAERWLALQAKHYGAALSFLTWNCYGLKHDITLPASTVYSARYPQLLCRTALRSFCSDPGGLASWIRRTTHCANVHVIIYVNGAGRDYADTWENEEDRIDCRPAAIIFNRDPWGEAGRIGTIAHEILHLYHAWDLYGDHSSIRGNAITPDYCKGEDEKQRKARQLFPGDIMLEYPVKLGELKVGALTAWRVGWNHHPEPWYGWFGSC